MTEIENIIILRDNISQEEAANRLAVGKLRVHQGEDPTEVLEKEFGLEPDYIFDIVDMC